MGSHAKYSASAANRWLSCPGSITLSESAPEQPTSKFAEEGTIAHACLEFILVHGEKVRFPDHFTKDMIDHALEAARWIWGEVKDDGWLLAEQKVDTSPFITENQFGTLDAAIVREFGRLTVIDYKYGAGMAVDPEGEDGRGNPQLIAYALGLSHEYNHNFSEVELVIIQPRAYHESGETIRRALYPMSEILAWGKKFKAAYRASIDPLAPLKAGSWCKWCPAAVICPELKEKALAEAQIVFDEVTGIESIPEPMALAIPNLGTILMACEKLESWIERVRDHATHVLQSGGEVAGFKLVQKRSIRKWVNANMAAEEARRVFGKEAFSFPELLSPAQFEKALKNKTGVFEFLAAKVTSESSGVTLVKDSDKRDKVVPVREIFNAPALPPMKKKAYNFTAGKKPLDS